MAKLGFIISSYGFGHLTRQIALKNAIMKLNPNHHIVFVISEEQESVFEEEILTHQNIKILKIPVTPKIANDDDSSINREASLEIYRRFWEWETQIRNDRAWEEILYPLDLIINDIECIHNPIAKKMEKKIINISNFTWSDILYGLGDEQLANNYQIWERMADLHLQLPFSTDCRGFKNPIKVGILSNNFDWTSINEFRTKYDKFKILILADSISDETHFSEIIEKLLEKGFMVMVKGINFESNSNNFVKIPQDVSYLHNYIAKSDLIVSKLGYGIVSEIITSGTRLLFWKRRDYIEDNTLGSFIEDNLLGEEFNLNSNPDIIVDLISKYKDYHKQKPIKNENINIAKFVLDQLN